MLWWFAVAFVTHTHVCRLVSVPLTRDPALTYFIATPTSDTVQAKAGKGPTRYGNDLMSASTPPGLRPPPSPSTTVFGQVVGLERVGGMGAHSLGQRVARGETRVVLVPWGYQANCSPVLWTSSALWADPGTRALFAAQLRPQSDWVGGLPTFDVGGAWHQPYLHGEFQRYDGRDSGAGQPDLSVNELWQLYEVLPFADSLQADPARAITPAREWARSHPDQARRWPATRIMQFLEFMAKPENR